LTSDFKKHEKIAKKENKEGDQYKEASNNTSKSNIGNKKYCQKGF
jgi:hypothetical protein